MQAAGRKRQMVHAVTVWNTETLAAMPLCFGNEMGAFALASSAVGGPQAQSCRRRGSKPLKVAGGGVANRYKRCVVVVSGSFECLRSWWHGLLGLGEAWGGSGLLPVMLLRCCNLHVKRCIFFINERLSKPPKGRYSCHERRSAHEAQFGRHDGCIAHGVSV